MHLKYTRARMQQRPHLRRPVWRQAGLSLIELMIAMVLGLIVVAAAFNAYMGTSRSAQFNSGLQALQENGRYGIGVMQQSLRLAGYSPNGLLVPLDVAAGSDTSLIVQVTEAFDCGGGDTATAATPGVAINTYTFVPPVGGDVTSGYLSCTGNVSGTPVRLVDNLEAFRVLYGLDSDFDEFREPERFVPWSAGIDPAEVVALRVALLANSAEPVRRRSAEETHVVLDSTVTTNDAFARHVYSSTIGLRNAR